MAENKFERGTSLTNFKSDRFEGRGALVAAFLIAIGVVMVVGN